MGTMFISIDAETEGKQLDFQFEWEGEDEEIDRLMEFVAAQADEAGITPQVLGTSLLYHLPTTGVADDPDEREFQMLVILDVVFRMAITDRPDTLVCDVAARQDIVVDLTVREKHVSGHLRGQPSATAARSWATAQRRRDRRRGTLENRT